MKKINLYLLSLTPTIAIPFIATSCGSSSVPFFVDAEIMHSQYSNNDTNFVVLEELNAEQEEIIERNKITATTDEFGAKLNLVDLSSLSNLAIKFKQSSKTEIKSRLNAETLSLKLETTNVYLLVSENELTEFKKNPKNFYDSELLQPYFESIPEDDNFDKTIDYSYVLFSNLTSSIIETVLPDNNNNKIKISYYICSMDVVVEDPLISIHEPIIKNNKVGNKYNIDIEIQQTKNEESNEESDA